jgi:hypothetical protein
MLLKELEKGPGASSLIINFVGKSGGLTSAEERMYEEKFNSHIDDILKRLKKGETIGKLASDGIGFCFRRIILIIQKWAGIEVSLVFLSLILQIEVGMISDGTRIGKV